MVAVALATHVRVPAPLGQAPPLIRCIFGIVLRIHSAFGRVHPRLVVVYELERHLPSSNCCNLATPMNLLAKRRAGRPSGLQNSCFVSWRWCRAATDISLPCCRGWASFKMEPRNSSGGVCRPTGDSDIWRRKGRQQTTAVLFFHPRRRLERLACAHEHCRPIAACPGGGWLVGGSMLISQAAMATAVLIRGLMP